MTRALRGRRPGAIRGGARRAARRARPATAPRVLRGRRRVASRPARDRRAARRPRRRDERVDRDAEARGAQRRRGARVRRGQRVRARRARASGCSPCRRTTSPGSTCWCARSPRGTDPVAGRRPSTSRARRSSLPRPASPSRVRVTPRSCPRSSRRLLDDADADVLDALRGFDRVLVGGQATPATLRRRAPRAGHPRHPHLRLERDQRRLRLRRRADRADRACAIERRRGRGSAARRSPRGTSATPSCTADRVRRRRRARAGTAPPTPARWDGERLAVTGRLDDVDRLGRGEGVARRGRAGACASAGLGDAVVVGGRTSGGARCPSSSPTSAARARGERDRGRRARARRAAAGPARVIRRSMPLPVRRQAGPGRSRRRSPRRAAE